jgi:para-nitrobenzyl esterase
LCGGACARPSPLAKGLFQRAIGESGGLFEPLQLAPKFLLANAERDGDKYAVSLGAVSLKELRRLPATLLTGNAGGIVHAVIEPYVLPHSPYETFTSGKQNDVPLLIGSNAEEARAMVDVTHETAATFDSDLEHSVGQLPPALVAAYPHATDEEARQAQLGLERDLRFGWDMWVWARLQAGTGQRPVFYYSFRQQPPFPAGSVYAGWGASHFAELWYVFDHLNQSPWNWTAADRKLAEEMSSYWVNFARSGDPNGPRLPSWPAFANAESKVQYLGDPITVGGVANIHGLSVFDAVYTAVRGKVRTAESCGEICGVISRGAAISRGLGRAGMWYRLSEPPPFGCKFSQRSDVGSIPIARSINPVDAVGFTGFHPPNLPIKCAILDAVGRGFGSLIPVGRGLFSKIEKK